LKFEKTVRHPCKGGVELHCAKPYNEDDRKRMKK